MPKNNEGKELDVFEQEMEHRIASLSHALESPPPVLVDCWRGNRLGLKRALAIYREFREDGTI